MEERAKFVLEALEGWTSMSALCEAYGISRRIGYKWLARYEAGGLAALEDLPRVRRRQAKATAPEVIAPLLALRQRHPTWGPRKLKARLEHLHPEISWPAASTMGEILRREGLVESRRRRGPSSRAGRSMRTEADVPNRVWTADFKGEFRLGSRQLCYPLTLVDAHSRYLLACQALPSTRASGVRASFERAFRAYGLPEVIRTDNGTPFRSCALAGLSQLAVWWIRLGIRLEWTRPRHPQDNGAHERMHRTLKAEATRPARATPELQQRAFDHFRVVYNEERPHEALGQRTPASCYRVADRAMPSRLPQPEYPERFLRRSISQTGRMCWRKRFYFVSEALQRQIVGLEHVHEGRFDLYFGPVYLGYLDEETRQIHRVRERQRDPAPRT